MESHEKHESAEREAASCKQVLKRTLDSGRKACDGQTRSINVERRGPEDLLERSKKVFSSREEKGQRPIDSRLTCKALYHFYKKQIKDNLILHALYSNKFYSTIKFAS